MKSSLVYLLELEDVKRQSKVSRFSFGKMIDKLEMDFDEEAEQAIENKKDAESKMSEEDYPLNSKLSPQKQLESLNQAILNLLDYNKDID